MYIWLKLIHVLAVASFLFGHGIAAGCSFALRSRPDADQARSLLRLSIWSYWITQPALAVLLVSGVWMGFVGRLWGHAWIWTAIVLLVAMYTAMAIISGPYHAAREVPASDDDELAARLTKTHPLTATWVGASGIVALVFLMVVKPF
jgi:hypothetical protein